MNWQKISFIASVVLFQLLAIFFIITCLLGFQNYPSACFALVIALILIYLCATWPLKSSSNFYNPLRDWSTIIFLVLLTLLPRILWIASVNTIQISDFKLYHQIASSLVEGSIHSQSYIRLFPHIIAYPFVLSWFYRLFGSVIQVAQVLNAILFVEIVLGVFFLGAQAFDKRFAILAAVIVSLWPSQLFYTTMVSTETLFTLLLILCVGLFYALRNLTHLTKGVILFGLLGVLVAITNAIRPFGLLFLFVVIGYYFVFLPPKSPGIRPWVVKFVLFLFLCLGYFMASNFIHYLIVRTVQGTVAKNYLGYYLLVGSNIESGGRYNESDSLFLLNLYQNGIVHPDEVNRILFNYALERIKSSPLKFIKLQVPKNKSMWQDDGFGININKEYRDEENPGLLSFEFMETITPISNSYYYTMLICCILGSVLGVLKRERGLVALVGLFILGTILVFFFTEVQERYHYHVLPLFALLAVYGLSEFNRTVGLKRQVKSLST